LFFLILGKKNGILRSRFHLFSTKRFEALPINNATG
jgi:hypothetical protein